MRRTAALIVGGGPAGSAAAIRLARAGATPLLIERERETGDALCGGFLSWRTLAMLEELGLDHKALHGAPIDRVRLFAGLRSAEARLPGPAIGLSRQSLDSALLAFAERQGATVERGAAAREALTPTRIRLDDGGEIEGGALLLATGKHDLRGLARPHEEAADDPALGLRVHLDRSPALAAMVGGAIELHLFDRGYAGLLLQEDGRANLCLAVRKSRLTEAGGKPVALVEAIGREAPALGERLAWLPSEPAIDAIGSVPYGWRARSSDVGLFRLGDQAGVIASLAGEGIGIALASGVAAARALIAGGSSSDFQRAFASRLARPMATASAIRALAERPATAAAITSMVRAAPSLAHVVARLTRIDR